MSTAALPFAMPKRVGRKVRLLRWLVRLYVFLDGLAAIGLVLGVAFWLCLGIDWAFEPSPFVRGLFWVLTILAAGYAAVRFFLGPISVKLSNVSMALLLERNFPELEQSLITTVEAADRRRSVPVGNSQLLQNTSKEAAETLRGLPVRRIFQLGPLLWKSGMALLLLGSIVAFSFLQSEAFGFWIERMQLTDQIWPRRVELSVAGFEEVDGHWVVNVARDDDFELYVNASIRDQHEAPDRVELRYRLLDGRRGRDTMTRVGEALAGRDEAQVFRYEFKKVAADLKFDLVGGDDRLRDLKLHVVERPQIFRMVIECEFPEYLGRTPQTIPMSDRVELPEGTWGTCRVEANKPLRVVRVHDPAQQIDLPVTIESEDDRQMSFPVRVEKEDQVLLITMRDSDGVENREPYRVVLSVIVDQPPEVSVQLRGIGTAVTRQARIPFAGQVTDEYGLQATWFEYQVEKEAPKKRATLAQAHGRRELHDLGAFDLGLNDPQTKRPLVALQPGQQLTLSLKASDAYDLNTKEHIGSSQRFMLDVVTNSELRALLEKKELALRQRFESIFEKMTGTRELLDRIDQQKERDRLRVSGALQNVVQLSYETLGVAEGIEGIVGELINNRVDTEEITQRLEQGIAQPLREIGGTLMPVLEQRLQALQASLREESLSKDSLVAAKVQGDVVLEAMQEVLDRMLELESYNELVELLRGIVADQQKIQKQTQQKRREKLRSLLED